MKGDELELWYHGQYPGMDVSTMSYALKSEENISYQVEVAHSIQWCCFGGNAWDSRRNW
jgi:hypothetical protein